MENKKKLKVPTRPGMQSLLWLLYPVLFGALFYITYCMAVWLSADGQPREGRIAAIFVLIFCWVSAIFVFVAVTILFCVNITITKEQVKIKGLLSKGVVYQMDEIKTCVIDTTLDDHMRWKTIVFSRDEIPPLDYRGENYGLKNKVWKNIDKETHATTLIKKAKKYIMVEVTEKRYEQIKTFLPERLLAQLEESEERLYAAWPNLRKNTVTEEKNK